MEFLGDNLIGAGHFLRGLRRSAVHNGIEPTRQPYIHYHGTVRQLTVARSLHADDGHRTRLGRHRGGLGGRDARGIRIRWWHEWLR